MMSTYFLDFFYPLPPPLSTKLILFVRKFAAFLNVPSARTSYMETPLYLSCLTFNSKSTSSTKVLKGHEVNSGKIFFRG